MEKSKYLEDLKQIKDIMNRSNKFISLSGLSGISIGITAFAGAYLAYSTIFKNNDYLRYETVNLSSTEILYLLLIASCTLIIAIGSALYFTKRKTKKLQQNAWDHQTKKLLINLFIPLITGGLFCLILLSKGFIGILPSLTLIFYGLALVNGSKFTINEIRNLGLIEIIIGLLAFLFIDYALVLWVIGFGLVQIIYGLIIQRKY